MRTKLFALFAALGLVLLALGPGVAAADDTAGNDALHVGVSQADDGSATVSVTQNESGVENASVAVEAVDNGTYAGTGDYTTDEDGTVGLPAPEENVTVEVTATAGNQTASTTADLLVANATENETDEFDNFGAEVSSYVHELLGDENRTGGIGSAVAEFVTANNPGNAGNAPVDTGPPEENETDRRGPPSDIFADDDERGPPADAGPPEDRGPGADDENETENETDGENGPPADAGPPEDRGADDGNETENETDAPEEDDGADRGNNGNGNGGGPPDDAGSAKERGN